MSDAVVNKRELADRLKVSAPTLDRWLTKFGDDFPVIERGSNGREWRFDVAAVFAFLRARQAAEAAKSAARDEQLAQLAFPFDPPPEQPATLSIADQLKALQLRRLQREEMEKSGQLVPAEAMRQVMFDAFTKQSRTLRAALTRECTELNLPAPIARRLIACIDEAQRAWVAEMRLRAAVQPPDAINAAA